MATREGSQDGVQFRAVEGRRSSQRVARGVFATAADAVDPALAARIRATKDWRKGYLAPLRDLVAAAARSPAAPVAMAEVGIPAFHSSVEFVRGGRALPVRDALSEHGKPYLTTVTVDGTGEREGEVAIPYRGELLRGAALNRRLDRWVADGIVEPSCADAVRAIASSPDWLDLSDLRFVLLGAASEMGPLRSLCRWGADVVAIDLPRPDLWKRITQAAREGSGRLHVPVPVEASAAELVESAGADLLTQTPEVATLLHDLGGPFVVGNYVYADGATFVRLAAAVDVLIESLAAWGALGGLAYLATPTDAFAVTNEIVEAARSKQSSKGSVVRALSAGRLYRPQYQDTIGAEGRDWGLYDCLVPQQGPNYALAKTIQRWRAILTARSKTLVSANVAPATLTHSVLRNKILAAAYAGAGRFGVEIFEPQTSSALEAVLLVHDIRSGARARSHPYDLFVEGAAHGGLWRMAHEPRSVLPLAVVGGMMRRTPRPNRSG
jgi:hypothetical protein